MIIYTPRYGRICKFRMFGLKKDIGLIFPWPLIQMKDIINHTKRT